MKDFSCCGGNDEHPQDHCMDCPKRLHWEDSEHLANADGITVARLYAAPGPTRRGVLPHEWSLYKQLDPKDSTRGTCSSASAARKAIERAVKTFGYFVSKE